MKHVLTSFANHYSGELSSERLNDTCDGIVLDDFFLSHLKKSVKFEENLSKNQYVPPL